MGAGGDFAFVLRVVAGRKFGREIGCERIPLELRWEGKGGGNPLRGATTGVVIRRRAASGEDGTRRFWFGGFFHMLGSGHSATCRLRRGRHEEVLFWGILSHAREWSFGYVPPQERTARGGFVLEDSFTRSELGNDMGLIAGGLLRLF